MDAVTKAVPDGTLQFEPIGEIALKGLLEPIALFRAVPPPDAETLVVARTTTSRN